MGGEDVLDEVNESTTLVFHHGRERFFIRFSDQGGELKLVEETLERYLDPWDETLGVAFISDFDNLYMVLAGITPSARGPITREHSHFLEYRAHMRAWLYDRAREQLTQRRENEAALRTQLGLPEGARLPRFLPQENDRA